MSSLRERYEDGLRAGDRIAEAHLMDGVGTGGYELYFRHEVEYARLSLSPGERAERLGIARAYRERVRTARRREDSLLQAANHGGQR